MVIFLYLAVTGIFFLWLMTRAPLWRTIEISIDQGLEAGAREPGTLG
jgi:hypothetical protein